MIETRVAGYLWSNAMTVHTPTIGPFAYGRRTAMPTCPQCDNMLVAPTTATFDKAGRVRHVWTCDECGHVFQTSIKFDMRQAA
jgi:hypothetical protein